MKGLYYILTTLVIIACKGERTADNNTPYFNEFYYVLNYIVISKFSGVTLIVDETTPVYRNMFGAYSIPKSDKDTPPPPPPPGIIYYDENTFDYLIYSGQLDSSEAKFMYNSIDSTITFKIDSSKVNLRLIPQNKLVEIFKNKSIDGFEKYNRLEKLFGAKCFIIISTPIFNSDLTKIILSIDYHCSPPDGVEYRFILEKRNNTWIMLNDEEIWEHR
jgi:hypothetical protein